MWYSSLADIPFTLGACSPTWREAENDHYFSVGRPDVGPSTLEETTWQRPFKPTQG